MNKRSATPFGMERIRLLSPVRAMRDCARRMHSYLSEMYPIPTRLFTAAATVFGTWSVVAGIRGTRIEIFSVRALIGIWSVFSLLLILRLMDELKDREVDARLFRERPLPAGRVREADLIIALVILIVLFFLANSAAGPAFWPAAFVLVYALLMFVYFFMPRLLRKHLLLNLATHNPIIPLIFCYLIVLFPGEAVVHPYKIGATSLVLSTAMLWAPFFAWEIARKIRSAEEEDDYVTYSRIFGRTGAVMVAGGAQGIGLVIGVYFFLSGRMSIIFVLALVASFSMGVLAYSRFLRDPNPKTSRLRSSAEIYALSMLLGAVLDYTIKTIGLIG